MQTLALLWTLLRQSPNGGPALRRAVIVCPASLVLNWKAEVAKWLGTERLACLCVRGGGAEATRQATEWAAPAQNAWPLLITSYETLRNVAGIVKGAGVGLLVCDGAWLVRCASATAALTSLAQRDTG